MNPKIYHLDHHQIRPEQIDEHASYVIEKLKRAGHTAYLVGGSVRDLLLRVLPKDFDISTSAKPEEVRALFQRNALLIGRRFRLVHIRFGKKILEVSTFRSGDPTSSNLIIRDNEWGTEEEDVLRRDFTINGLFYDPASETIIDYVGGYSDIEDRVLRTIGEPLMRFQQDPVRMLRLLKFCARFDFAIDPATLEALVECKQSILQSSSVRVFEELCRMLESGASKAFFHLLYQYGMLSSLLPELSHFFDRNGSEPTLALLEEIDGEIKKMHPTAPDRSLLLATLLYPLIEGFCFEIIKPLEAFPHLGEIASIVHHAIDCVFAPFFTLPKRLRAQIAFLLTSQFRFVPLEKKAVKRHRIPNEPSVQQAIFLLKLRASKQPDLHATYTRLSQMVPPSAEHIPYTPRTRPRRRR